MVELKDGDEFEDQEEAEEDDMDKKDWFTLIPPHSL